jgi:Putative prokaryotic signal transducing protein
MSDGPVRVYASGNPINGQLTKGRLEAEGIVVMMKGEGEGPYRTGPVYLWVSPEDASHARDVIEAIAAGAYTVTDDDAIEEDGVADGSSDGAER